MFKLFKRLKWRYYLLRGLWRRQFRKRLYTYDDLMLYGEVCYDRGFNDAIKTIKEDLTMGIVPDEVTIEDLEEAIDKLKQFKSGEDFLSV